MLHCVALFREILSSVSHLIHQILHCKDFLWRKITFLIHQTCQKYFSFSVSHSISKHQTKINHQRQWKEDKMIFCFHLHDFLIAISQKKKQTKSSPFKLSFGSFDDERKESTEKFLSVSWVMLKKEFFLRTLWLISRLFIHRFLYVMRGAKIKDERERARSEITYKRARNFGISNLSFSSAKMMGLQWKMS